MQTINKPYNLSDEQQQILDSQIDLDKNLYRDADTIYTDLKNRYKL